MTIPHALVDRFRADLARAGAEGAIGVAVSGGPDSLALLLLAEAAHPGTLRAATVDHGLRPEGASEAAGVAALCAARGIAHDRLAVAVLSDGTGVQAAARAARYAALGRWAAAEGIGCVLTAHHADDQAETLLMRLARGAGLGGLSGIRERRPLAESVTLARPLLGWRKAELAGIVAAAGLDPADDPSNHDPRYDRTAARALLRHADWLRPERLAASASHLAAAEAALDWTAAEAARSRIVKDGNGVSLDPGGLPPELVRRLVRIALDRLGTAADGPAVARLMTELSSGRPASIGNYTAVADTCWRFMPAPARRSH